MLALLVQINSQLSCPRLVRRPSRTRIVLVSSLQASILMTLRPAPALYIEQTADVCLRRCTMSTRTIQLNADGYDGRPKLSIRKDSGRRPTGDVDRLVLNAVRLPASIAVMNCRARPSETWRH